MSVIEETGRSLSIPATSPSLAHRRDRFSYDDKIVRAFTLMTLVWALVAFLVGLFIAFELVLPSAIAFAHNRGMDWLEKSLAWIPLVPQLSFGRLRPLHTNAAIF